MYQCLRKKSAYVFEEGAIENFLEGLVDHAESLCQEAVEAHVRALLRAALHDHVCQLDLRREVSEQLETDTEYWYRDIEGEFW
jgi:hypothetical protein